MYSIFLSDGRAPNVERPQAWGNLPPQPSPNLDGPDE